MTKKGITLVEVMVSSLILLFVIAGIFAILNVGNNTWNRDMILLDLEQSARLGMNGMVSEIRQAKQIDAFGADVITFKMPDEITTSSITYRLNTNSHQIVREYVLGNKVIANNIFVLNFTYVGKVVTINMTARKTIGTGVINFPLTEQVRLRNANS